MDISSTCFCYWGKADREYPGEPKWHPLVYHSLDVAAVAAAFWACSPAVRQAFRAAFKAKSDEALRAWVLFFVALHDVGKLHALFQIKAPEALALAWPDFDISRVLKGRPYDHGCSGFGQADEEIPEWISADGLQQLRAFADWLAAVTGHHGSICRPDPGSPTRVEYASEEIQRRDADARREWVTTAEDLFLAPAGVTLRDAPPKCGAAARSLLAGFCSLCDWIGSNTDLFPYQAPDKSAGEYLAWALDHLDRKKPFERFGLSVSCLPYTGLRALLRKDEEPRGVQTLVDQLPDGNGLTIVEAPTGSGKTEAALALAWRAVAAGKADSIVLALPTQATANAMLARAEGFAQRAYGHRPNLVLAHGNRALNAGFRRLVESASYRTAQKTEEAGAQCSTWLASSRKRVFLGQIGVCTVDQVLLSVLPVRHSFVRGFGLNRSVLIVDEVHAYDAYMNGLLEEVLRRQKATGGSAILLSATLPAAVRRELVKAWDCELPDEAPYPAVWTVVQGPASPLALAEADQPEERAVEIELLERNDAFPDPELTTRIIDAANAGALVGIVLNTVDDAQRLARQLRNKSRGIPVDLFHARYRLRDRQRIEDRVLAHYGRAADRKKGRILVATQVIEQSLDLDMDWLVTQLCPVDLLFQRLGRLHRHARAVRPAGFEVPRCTVIAPQGDEYGIHSLIYGDTRLLWRTKKRLETERTIVFPNAYREWIEDVYAEDAWDDEPERIIGEHFAWKDDCRDALATARQRTTMTISELRDDDSVATSLTRDGEMSLSILPLLAKGVLLDGTRLADLDERDRPETLLLGTVPAPASWGEWFRDCERDADGRLELILERKAEDGWTQSAGVFTYSIEYGLEKSGGRGDAPAT